MNGYEEDDSPYIRAELSGIEDTISGYGSRTEFEKEILGSSGYDGALIANDLSEGEFEKRLLYLTLANVNEQVDIACEKYGNLIGDDFAVIGGFYDFKNELGMGRERL